MSVLSLVELVVALLALCVAVSLVSLRLRVPYTLALVVAGLVIGVADLLPGVGVNPDLILFLFLPALLFEGAWSLDLRALRADWLPIFLFAVPGVLLTVGIVGGVLYLLLGFSWLLALLVGAVLSPTDPVAVLALFRQLRMPERLRVILEGESLFNDGVGAAVFEITLGLLLATLALPARQFGINASGGAALLTVEVIWLLLGGLALGLLVGWLVNRLLLVVDNFLFETALTFTVAYGVYLIASVLHTSGILAVIGAGLVLGNVGKHASMSARTREAASDIWQFTGYLANSFLFLLLGLQLSAGHLLRALPAIGAAVLGVVAGRGLMIALALRLHGGLARWLRGSLAATGSTATATTSGGNGVRKAVGHGAGKTPRWAELIRTRWRGALIEVPRIWRPLLLFSGLRGALSIALVLSLPAALPTRSYLEAIVYGVVLVTLVGQGFLLRLVLPHWPTAPSLPGHPPAHPSAHTTMDNAPAPHVPR